MNPFFSKRKKAPVCVIIRERYDTTHRVGVVCLDMGYVVSYARRVRDISESLMERALQNPPRGRHGGRSARWVVAQCCAVWGPEAA